MKTCLPCSQPSTVAPTSDEDAPWSSTWEEARDKFRRAAKACGASLEALEYSAGPGGVWASDRQLTIDVAVLGDAASAPAMFIHTSGTHGVEGFAGSAIQVAYLRSAKPRPGVAIVMVHGVNAHGFAEGRRWNERGVDLNRNFVGVREGGTIEGTTEPLTFDGLAELPYDLYYTASPIVNLQRPPPMGCCGQVEFYGQAAAMIASHGFGPLKQAIAGGHYSNKSGALVAAGKQPGLFFGGTELEESNRLLHSYLTRLGASRAAPIARASHVDVHTALGPFGHDSLLVVDTRRRS